MTADGGEEQLQLLRLLDYQGFPADELAYNLSAFSDRIRCLFTGVAGQPPACFQLGFTAHMLSVLKHPVAIQVANGSVRYIGSVDGVPLTCNSAVYHGCRTGLSS